jgi:hypothetical protein
MLISQNSTEISVHRGRSISLPDPYSLHRNSQLTDQISESTRSKPPVVVTLGRWVVPNIGRQPILERTDRYFANNLVTSLSRFARA